MRLKLRDKQLKDMISFSSLQNWFRSSGIKSCEKKAQSIAATIPITTRPVNVGGGINNPRWPNARVIDALIDDEIDFNTKQLWYDDNEIELAICEQVIEHLHNTDHFLNELYRVIKPGGHLLISTENLASIPNLFAMILQRAPFSTQPICGRYVGGWKSGTAAKNNLPKNHPAYSGVSGHVRVLTCGQLKEMLSEAGFQIMSKHGYSGNHYILIHAIKPCKHKSKALHTISYGGIYMSECRSCGVLEEVTR